MSATIDVIADFYNLRIFIEGSLHVHIKREDLLAVQSWRDSSDNFSIEYTMRGGTMLTEYTNEERWWLVLAGLERVLGQ